MEPQPPREKVENAEYGDHYLTELPEHLLREAEKLFGIPREVRLEQDLLPWELELIERVCGQTRFHDMTVFVLHEESLALVHKPSEPPGVFWTPAGGLHQGEPVAEGIRREVMEETGLEVQTERYLLRVDARFYSEGRCRPWTSHVFLARPAQGGEVVSELTPIDTKEVESAAWVTVESFLRRTAPLLRETQWGRFNYRLELARLAFAELGLPHLEV